MAPRPAHALLLLGATADLFCTIMKNDDKAGDLPPLTKNHSVDTTRKLKIPSSENPQRRKSVFADFSFRSRSDSQHHKVSRSGSQTKHKISPSEAVPQSRVAINESQSQHYKICVNDSAPKKSTSPNGSPTIYPTSQVESQAFVKVSTRRPSKIQMSSREPSIQLTNSPPAENNSSPFLIKSLPSKTNTSHQKVFPSDHSPTSNILKTSSTETPPLSPPLKIYSDLPPFESSSIISLPSHQHGDTNFQGLTQDGNYINRNLKKSVSGISHFHSESYRQTPSSRQSQSSLSKTPSTEHQTITTYAKPRLAEAKIQSPGTYLSIKEKSATTPTSNNKFSSMTPTTKCSQLSEKKVITPPKKGPSSQIMKSLPKEPPPTALLKKASSESMPSPQLLKTLPTKPPPSQLIETLAKTPSPSSSQVKNFPISPPQSHPSRNNKNSKTSKSEKHTRKVL